MRVVVNTRRVRRNRQIAQYAFFVTLGVLILGLFVTNAAPNNPVLLIAPLIVLPIGVIATIYSVRMANLWLREPRPEAVLQQGLKGQSTRSVLYHYFFPARHLLISPQGVFSLTIRPQDGRFTVKGDRWRKQGSLMSQFMTFFRQDAVGNPHLEAQHEAARTQQLLDQVLPGAGVTVQPLIVMIGPYAEVEVEESSIPILYADSKKKPNLKTFFKDIKKGDEAPAVSLSDEQIAQLEQAQGIVAEAQ